MGSIMKKLLTYLITAVCFVLPASYFFPRLMLFFLLCGVYDVSRNRRLNPFVVGQYFLGNGILTWLLSPFNILMDILSLPYINKGVYRLEDLPGSHQAEIRHLLDTARNGNLVGRLEEKTKNIPRSMTFFKWYGDNVDTSLNIPAFHESYKFVKTIGISTFNQKESTSRHFGPLRATLRVLYNINSIVDDSVYIEVGDVKNYWRENKLFIFDDTLLHQSFNESNKPRYCLFVDILRPSPFPALLGSVVSVIRFFLRGVNHVFYKNWKVIKS
jgi:aspartyl/asparaginyl beta-hydroxylase (cupin superfamily)